MITHEELLARLHYDPATGRWRRKRLVGWPKPKNEDDCTMIVPNGMRKQGLRALVKIRKRPYAAARLAFFYMTRRWPVVEMDHRNGDPVDNRWNNLREATRHQNEINKSRYKNNKSGFKGVRLQKGKYVAAIMRDRHRRHLGSFDTAEEASAVYLAAARVHDGAFFRP